MKFLIVRHDSKAEIYGYTYNLKALDNPKAGLKDILVADDGSASELLKRHKEILATADFDYKDINGFPLPLKTLEEIPPGSRILLLRSGGIGDHIMLLPAIHALNQALSGRSVRIWISAQADMSAIFQGIPYIDRIFPLPIPLEDLQEADYLVDFSQSIASSDFNKKHPTDFYLALLGIKNNNQGKIPALNPNPDERPLISRLIHLLRDEYNGRPIILIQWQASVHIRTLPPEKLIPLIRDFQEYTFIVGHHFTQAEKSISVEKDVGLNIVNISAYMRELDDFIYAVNSVDGVISTDSSAYHVAAACNKPALALFGAIDSRLRTCYYPKTIPIDSEYKGSMCQSPCNLHKGTCPEAQHLNTPYSPCLLSIPEKKICDIFKKFADTYL